jgi:hypothetical protein
MLYALCCCLSRGAVKQNDEIDVHLPRRKRKMANCSILFLFLYSIYFFKDVFWAFRNNGKQSHLGSRFWAFRNKGSSKTRLKKSRKNLLGLQKQ